MHEAIEQKISRHTDRRVQLPWPTSDLLYDTADLLSGRCTNIEDALAKLSSKLGFDYFSLVTSCPAPHRSEASTTMRSNYQATWKQRYEERSYGRIDPVVHVGRTGQLPYLWGRPNDLSGMTPVAEQLMSEGRAFNIRFGLSIPTHGPTGGLSLLTMTTSDTAKTLEDLVRASYNLLWMISPIVNAAVWMDKGAVAASTETVVLTEHEKTCLLWTLRGKTSWEISRIVSRSKPTVEYHLQKSMRKFGVTTKIQAAVRAMKEGIIEG
jgi:DNA-binding CsgD family transcriptional regulator